jgi:hypothetical protein
VFDKARHFYFDKNRRQCLTPIVAAEVWLPSWSRARETQNPQAIEDGAHEAGPPVSRPLSRPSPTANLVGNWKGDPLIREVCGLKFTQEKCYGVVAFCAAALFIVKIMLDVIYIGIMVAFFAAFLLYARGCEKL